MVANVEVADYCGVLVAGAEDGEQYLPAGTLTTCGLAAVAVASRLAAMMASRREQAVGRQFRLRSMVRVTVKVVAEASPAQRYRSTGSFIIDKFFP